MRALLLGVAILGPGEDLARRYPGRLEHSATGLSSRCGPADVWRLQSFTWDMGKDLELELRSSTVAFGVHEENVLWAVVFPDKPAPFRPPGANELEHASSIFLRFAPAEVGRMFPARTVREQGDPKFRALATRIFAHKIGWRWSTPAGNTTVVPPGWYVLDIDTAEGTRRAYAFRRDQGQLLSIDELSEPTPPLQLIERGEALEVFDDVYAQFDRSYAMFVLLPDLDWSRFGRQARKRAATATTTLELAAVLADLLSHLEDLHVWVKAGEDFLPGYARERPLNAHWEGSQALTGPWQARGKDLHSGRTGDGIGYLNVTGLADGDLPQELAEALEELADTWALVVDLRFNGGGGEDLAAQVAGRFLDRPRVYAKNRYRSGDKHSQLGPILERSFEPRGPWRYQSPIVVLWGRKTLSSAEALAFMFKQCPDAVTMGSPTGGSSGNPTRLAYDCGITVNMPRWISLTPEETPIERVGVLPDEVLEFPEEEYTPEHDPLLERALERLREIPKSKRAPGRREKP